MATQVTLKTQSSRGLLSGRLPAEVGPHVLWDPPRPAKTGPRRTAIFFLVLYSNLDQWASREAMIHLWRVLDTVSDATSERSQRNDEVPTSPRWTPSSAKHSVPAQPRERYGEDVVRLPSRPDVHGPVSEAPQRTRFAPNPPPAPDDSSPIGCVATLVTEPLRGPRAQRT